MTAFWNYEPRRPRHSATERVTRVQVRARGATEWREAQLADLSRHGVRLIHAPKFSVDDQIELHFPFDETWLDKIIPATVRWNSDDACGDVTLACHCDVPVDWELLGELILLGALDTCDPQPSES
ncbi:MAG: PilZ domain-containing protein [Planctomycetales bacterium]|nr:PilZ domain-containing protein [Planctomycetales bacterium]